jgi:hypothetical protein
LKYEIAEVKTFLGSRKKGKEKGNAWAKENLVQHAAGTFKNQKKYSQIQP